MRGGDCGGKKCWWSEHGNDVNQELLMVRVIDHTHRYSCCSNYFGTNQSNIVASATQLILVAHPMYPQHQPRSPFV
jgi:hypothetical protein